MPRCDCFFKFLDFVYASGKAVLVRAILSAGIFVVTLRAATVYDVVLPDAESEDLGNQLLDTLAKSWMFWLPLIGIVLFIPEFIVTVKVNKGHDFKWWSPSFCIYVYCMLPCIWLIEINMWKRRREHAHNTSYVEPDEPFGTIAGYELKSFLLPASTWTRILEQMSFLVIIFAKWLSPKGTMTREGLSQLLLVYISIATDTLDIIDTFKEPQLANEYEIVLIVMVAYSFAHIQFTLNYTAKIKAGKPLTGVGVMKQTAHELKHACCGTELWAMLCTMLFQDGPFFGLRLYFIFGHQVISYSNIFFTCKNGIILFMDFYRISSILCEALETDHEAEGVGPFGNGQFHRKSLAVYNSLRGQHKSCCVLATIAPDSIVEAHLEPENEWKLTDKDFDIETDGTRVVTFRLTKREKPKPKPVNKRKSSVKPAILEDLEQGEEEVDDDDGFTETQHKPAAGGAAGRR